MRDDRRAERELDFHMWHASRDAPAPLTKTFSTITIQSMPDVAAKPEYLVPSELGSKDQLVSLKS